MKVWVPKQREVKVEVITEANPDNDLKPGDLMVTDADGKTKVWSPAEFAERFEEVERASWPGYLKRKAGDQFMNGTLTVGFEGATLQELVDAMNAWAAKSENRHLILGDNGDRYFQSADGRFYAIYYCYAQQDPLATEHLDEMAALEKKVKEEWEKKKAELKIDERNQLAKAQELREAHDAIERTKRRELERKASIADHCVANHGKQAGKRGK